MIQVIGNNGYVYRFGDINLFYGQMVYLYNDQSTPINLGAVWLTVQQYPIPTVPLDILINSTPTQEMIDAINEQYFWLIGDAQHGGLCFWHSGETSMSCNTWSVTDMMINSIPSPNFGELYIYDRIYEAGVATQQSSYIVCNSDNDGRLEGERITIIPPVPPDLIPYIQTFFATQPVATLSKIEKETGWNYIGVNVPAPIGIGVNSSDSSTVEVGPVSTLINKSPYYLGSYGNIGRITWWDGAELVVEDPYQDTSSDDEDPDSGGGGGTIHDSIDIDFPELPPEMILGSGMIKVYVPTAQNLKDLCTWLYSRPDAVITNLKKIWANPMESIISLHIVPLVAPILGTEEVKFCGIGTGVTMPLLQNQYMTIDCGTLVLDSGTVVPEEYKNFVDYGAFTRIRLYLPFIGIVDLNTDDVVGAQLHVKYNVDLFTGAVVAFVKSTKTNAGRKIRYDSVLYAFNGNFLLSAPITANNWGALYQSLVGSVTHIAQATVDPIGGAAGLAGDFMSPKVHAQRSGNIVGGQGFIGEWKPYIIIERPPLNVPDNNGAYNGYMCNKYLKLGTCKGFTQVTDGTMRIKNTLATDQELQMIKEELEAGVVF